MKGIALVATLLVMLFATATAVEWDTGVYVSTASNPNFGNALKPHPPIVVRIVNDELGGRQELTECIRSRCPPALSLCV